MKLENIEEKIDAYFDSEAGKKHLEDMNKCFEIRNQRHKKFKKYLETHDFDDLMYRLINEHNDKYIENCYHNGCEPYPNNKLIFVIGYVTIFGKPVKIKKINSDFSNNIWEFKGYFFQMIYGQGTLIRIFNKDDLKMLLQL